MTTSSIYRISTPRWLLQVSLVSLLFTYSGFGLQRSMCHIGERSNNLTKLTKLTCNSDLAGR